VLQGENLVPARRPLRVDEGEHAEHFTAGLGQRDDTVPIPRRAVDRVHGPHGNRTGRNPTE